MQVGQGEGAGIGGPEGVGAGDDGDAPSVRRSSDRAREAEHGRAVLEDQQGHHGERQRTQNNGQRTADDRFISLILLQSDKFWTDFVTRLGMPDMATDERFAARPGGYTRILKMGHRPGDGADIARIELLSE